MDPPWAGDQLLCHQCLYHADRDWYPRIRFLGIPPVKESSIFQTFGNLKDFFKACLTVSLCYSWKLAVLSSIHTQISSPLFQAAFAFSWRLSVHGSFSCKYIMKVLWLFFFFCCCSYSVIRLLNIALTLRRAFLPSTKVLCGWVMSQTSC